MSAIAADVLPSSRWDWIKPLMLGVTMAMVMLILGRASSTVEDVEDPPVEGSSVCDSSGTQYYVRDGGSGSGTTWSDAADQVPTAPSRGVDVYVADGTYSGRTFTTAASGSTLIRICKATESNHGTDTGWQSTYGDGQASFGDINFDSDYWTWDGAFRDEDCPTTDTCGWADEASYGFLIVGAFHTYSDATVRCGDNITVRYTAIDANGGADAIKASCFTGASTTNFTAYRNYIHSANGGFAAAHMTVVDGCLFDENYFGGNEAKETIRGQSEFKNCVISRNIMRQSCLHHATEGGCTCHIAIWDGGSGDFDNVEVYGNVIDDRGNSGSDGPSSSCSILIGGNGSSWAGEPASNARVFNNTIVGVANTTPSILVNGGSGNVCRNNLFYNNTGNPSVTCSTTSNNGSGDESVDPFVGYSSGNFHLTGAMAGSATDSPADNATDIDGVTRSTPDRGAFEFVP